MELLIFILIEVNLNTTKENRNFEFPRKQSIKHI